MALNPSQVLPLSWLFSSLLLPGLFNSLSGQQLLGSIKYDGGFSGDSDGKESACSAGDLDWIPGSGRFPGERNGNPLQYSCLENPMDRGAWRAIVHGVTGVEHDLATKSHTIHEHGLSIYLVLPDLNHKSCTPGLPVHHQLLEPTQTHVHRVDDAIQPSWPLSSSSPAPNPFQHQGLFQ